MRRHTSRIERLESRLLFVITAAFADGILTVNGDGADNNITVSRDGAGNLFVNGGAVPILGGPATVLNTTGITLNGGDGNDTLAADAANGPLPPTTMIGGIGNDTMIGSSGAERMFGGPGDDDGDGNAGADQFFGGPGFDDFVWDPGDGSDLVEGGPDTDGLIFNGNANAEVFNLVDNGKRATFTRNLGNIVMDLDDLELVRVNAFGGADTITVNDLGGTDVSSVIVILSPNSVPSAGGDGAADVVNVLGDDDDDDVTVNFNSGATFVNGFHAQVVITDTEGANDRLLIDTAAGDDAINASAIPAGTFNLITLNGGAGDDTILGSAGIDLINAGGGGDEVDGNQGGDTAFLGGGNDRFTWDPGDGSDVVEGDGGGNDTLRFNGNNNPEIFTASANGSRARFTRDLGNINMDLNDVERIDLNALGGIDFITVNDLAGTDVRNVDVDLSSPADSGIGDGAGDLLLVNGTAGDDRVVVRSGPGNSVNLAGLAARINFTGVQGARDNLRVNGLGGADDLIASSVSAAALLQLHLDGGSGDDDLFGGAGNNLLDGGADTDTVDGNAGIDTALNAESTEDVP